MNYIKHALEYRERGWGILPIGREGKCKKPPHKFKWKPFQTRRPTEDELRGWFKLPNLAGLAVVLGPVSGGLYCRDFDDAEAYRRWATEHLELARLLPTVTAKRGPHVYFCSPEKIRTRDYGDGELRGVGGYCVLPPSVHYTGHLYRWTIPLPPSPVPTADPREAGFCRNWNCTEKTERTEMTERTENTELTDDHRANICSGLWPCGFDVGELVALALPTDTHQNNKQLFLLARGVKALEKRRGRELPQAELRRIFGAWYERATLFLREDQSRDEYWFEFLYGLERVKYPLGEEAISQAWAKTHTLPPPKIAEQFDQPEIRLLVTLCRELQRAAGREPFYLSCRTVARLFHHDTHTTAARWLGGLCRTKIIRVTEKGGPDTNKASRYKYLHPLDE